jgi:hypothetical protein
MIKPLVLVRRRDFPPTKVPDCTVDAHFYIVVVLHTARCCYTTMVLQTVVDCTAIVLETTTRYYTMFVARYYTTVVSQVVFSLTHPTP